MPEDNSASNPTSSSQNISENDKQSSINSVVKSLGESENESEKDTNEIVKVKRSWKIWQWFRNGKIGKAVDSDKNDKKKRGWVFKLLVAFLILFLLLMLSVAAAATAAYYYLMPYYQELQATLPQVNQQVAELKVATKEQNLTKMTQGVTDLRSSLNNMDRILNDFSWVEQVPRAKDYWYDGKHLTAGGGYLLDAAQSGIDSLLPYADLVGFTVETEEQAEGKISPKVASVFEDSSENKIAAVVLLSEPINDGIKSKFSEYDIDISGENGDLVNVDITSDALVNLESMDKVVYVYLESESKQVATKFSSMAFGGAQTAEDRIQFVVDTLDKLVPQLEEISVYISKAEQEFSQIDTNRYPEEFRGFRVRGMIAQMKDLTSQAKILITDARPVLEVAPYILGNEEPREYLVLLQNDAELRPTGGFLTAYSLLTVDKGKITPGISKDIYDLDNRYRSKKAAPEPLVKYIPDPYAKEKASGITPKLRIRDSNLSPDFKEAMDLFYEEYQQTGSKDVDGIIAVNTKFLLGLLEVLGPIGVGGIGNFSAEIVPECNCPQVIYELESAISYETPYFRENRKAIIGPLMHSVLSNAMGTPKDKMSDLVQAGLDAIQQKHLLVYYLDDEVQSAVESFNMAGRVVEAENDYLMIVDSNFAGAKANLYVQQEVELSIDANEDTAVHELTITYKNPQPHDGWLNGEYFDWLRVYLPQGSKLLEDVGSETPMETYDDLGKTVFSGFFSLRPEGLAKLTLKYETSVNELHPYKLLIQKQGGTDNWYYNVNVNGQVQELDLDGDKKLIFDI